MAGGQRGFATIVGRTCLALALAFFVHTASAQQSDDDDDTLVSRQPTEASADNLLDDALLQNPNAQAALRAQAATPEPTGADPKTLSQFLLKRGKSALAIGKPVQAVRDLRRAVTINEKAPSLNRSDAFFALGQAENLNGRFTSSAKDILTSIENEKNTARLLARYSYLTQVYTKAGNLEAANATLEKCESILPGGPRQQQSQRQEEPPQASGRKNNLKAGSAGPGGPNSSQRNNQVTSASQANARRPQWDAQIARARAAVLQGEGHYVEAETLIRQRIADVQRVGGKQSNVSIANQRMGLAENLRAQGRLSDAENEIRISLAAFQSEYGSGAQRVGVSLLALGRILADEGRAKEGEALARKGGDVIKAAGAADASGAHATLGDILSAQYQWQGARSEFEAMRDSLKDDPEHFESFTDQDPNYALSLLKTGAVSEALKEFSKLYDNRNRDFGANHYQTAEARRFLAAALTASGRKDDALGHFAAAAPTLIESLGEEDGETGNRSRDQRLRLILESYIQTLLDVRGTPAASKIKVEPVSESFRLADAARGRDTLRALAASAARAAADDPKLADMARQEQDLQKQVSALNGLLANAVSARADERDKNAVTTLQNKIKALRGERAVLVKKIAAAFPDYGRILSPQPATVADVRARLHTGEALLGFYSSEDTTYAWAIPASGDVAVVAAPIGRVKLDDMVKHLRAGLDFSASSIEDVPVFDVAAAYDLYLALMRPIESAWGNATLLFEVPHGPINTLPLQLLPTEKPEAVAGGAVPFAQYRQVAWLARRVAIAQLPSTGALSTLRALPKHNTTQRAFVAFGDPIFSKEQAGTQLTSAAVAQRGIAHRSAPRSTPNYSAEMRDLPRLPDTAEEVLSIANVLHADPAKDVFLQAKASEATVRKLDLSQWRVVMFATHGLIPGDLTGLDQPALALSSPDVTGEFGTGLLTMERIMRLKLNADWVVLSACNTAAGEGAGGDAVSGLGRAFFYAGARSLLVSNWPVESTAARLLTTDLFKSQADDPKLSRAEALRLSMIRLIDSPGPSDGGQELFSYAHPSFWAPFSLVGDGAGSMAAAN